MKNIILSVLLIVTIETVCQGQIRSKEIPKNEIDKFISGLVKDIYEDTLRFEKRDLFSPGPYTMNKNGYSKIYRINEKFFYELDIIPGTLVKEFVNEILRPEIIKKIEVIENGNESLAVYAEEVVVQLF
ncbi:MAG: hypothetical protein RIM99_06205 [Cyclobacteriaceae bacterium]